MLFPAFFSFSKKEQTLSTIFRAWEQNLCARPFRLDVAIAANKTFFDVQYDKYHLCIYTLHACFELW